MLNAHLHISVNWQPTPGWTVVCGLPQCGGNAVNSRLLCPDQLYGLWTPIGGSLHITVLVCWLPQVVEKTFICSSQHTDVLYGVTKQWDTKHFSKNISKTVNFNEKGLYNNLWHTGNKFPLNCQCQDTYCYCFQFINNRFYTNMAKQRTIFYIWGFFIF